MSRADYLSRLDSHLALAPMGHSSITITYDRYGHLFHGSEAEAGAALETYLESAK